MVRVTKRRSRADIEDEAANGILEDGTGMDEEYLMELQAARQIMEEQGKERRTNNATPHAYNKAGLLACAEAIDTRLPFTDSFVCKCNTLELDEKDVEDDIKREKAFYNNALDAVIESVQQLEDASIPVVRPDDYMCEMIKGDMHMSRIKDRLIFEQQKMEAFEKRRDRKNQSAYAKEKREAVKKERLQQQKSTLTAVDRYRKDRRSAPGRELEDSGKGLDAYLEGAGGAGYGVRGRKGQRTNKEYKDKKFGLGMGGRKQRKIPTSKELNDMSGFNPRSGKQLGKGGRGRGGGGGKKNNFKKGSIPNRPGKAARMAQRDSRRK